MLEVRQPREIRLRDRADGVTSEGESKWRLTHRSQLQDDASGPHRVAGLTAVVVPLHAGRGAHNGVDWGSRGSRRYVRRAIESSLRRLRTDWIDLYQIHRPDPQTPIEETLSALTDLVHEGKVRYIGHSNFTGWQAAEAEWIAQVAGTKDSWTTTQRTNLILPANEGTRTLDRDFIVHPDQIKNLRRGEVAVIGLDPNPHQRRVEITNVRTPRLG